MQNISTGNLPLKQPNSQTTAYFNNFFKPDLTISQNVDSAVLTYFESITGSTDSARVLASTILYTALTQGLDPMQVITDLNNLSRKNKVSTPAGSKFQDQVEGNSDVYAKPGPTANTQSISEIDAYLTTFLNLNRVNTSLLGITNTPQTSKYVTRAILP